MSLKNIAESKKPDGKENISLAWILMWMIWRWRAMMSHGTLSWEVGYCLGRYESIYKKFESRQTNL